MTTGIMGFDYGFQFLILVGYVGGLAATGLF